MDDAVSPCSLKSSRSWYGPFEVVSGPGPGQQCAVVVDQGDVVVVAGPVDSAGDGRRIVAVPSGRGMLLLVAAVRGGTRLPVWKGSMALHPISRS
jgi:hypothetical protein